MLTSKQRAKLRGMAQHLEPIVHIGKDDVTDNIITQADDALEARELIKCTVQQNSGVTAREACDKLCEALGADGISVLGRKFVLYRESKNKKKIEI
ncbi:MAG: ribosome assembly RNA-binding protein YhbY [Christensenella sp.]|uniref:ribosome assembly RNA-binding protein YhbY n=1 Tax=Christensenella sp. TaxID=1935934 RepID=UPI002B1F604C|nr:ribosome assembly RNA-binding protein YhbY [Christensenella sp.]MEA5002457.1 ribosome assembly RNA-binding protein YhbY [Christensenella sp.]